MANDNNDSNKNAPLNISWDDAEQVQATSNSPVYRGSTQIEQSTLQSDAFAFGTQMGKNAPRVGNVNDALNIRFTSVNDKQQEKQQQAPMIQVVSDSSPASGNAQPLQAPKYDGFQPQYAHRSLSKTPLEMKQTLQALLSALVDSACIDWHEKSCFVYQGRAYSSYDDCEFLISIFSDAAAKSVIELRRSSGETFTFANIEENILSTLKQNGSIVRAAIDQPQSPSSNSESDQATPLTFEYGFGSLPPLDFGLAISDGDDDNKQDNHTTNVSEATQIVQDAVALETTRDILRSDIAYLDEQIVKHGPVFKNIPNITSTIIHAIADNLFYDCWAIKTYLTIISRLIALEAAVPSDLRPCVEKIQVQWSGTVMNEFIRIEFYPSQQIVKQCRAIIEQLC